MYVCTYICKKSAIHVEVGIEERVIAGPSGICGAQNASQLKSLARYIWGWPHAHLPPFPHNDTAQWILTFPLYSDLLDDHANTVSLHYTHLVPCKLRNMFVKANVGVYQWFMHVYGLQ